MPTSEPRTPDLARTVMAVLFILGLIAGCLWILRPFLTAIICATTIAIATWPMLEGLARRWGGRRGLAITAMMAALLIAFLAPVYFGTVAAVQSVGALMTWVHDLPNRTMPALPEWLARLPIAGARIQSAWADLTAGGGEGVRARLSEHTDEILGWLVVHVGNLAGMLVQVLVTLGITGLLYVRGNNVSAALLRFARCLAGNHGEQAARLAASATRGVALGVVLTPLIQSILAGIGMATAGIPHFGLIAVGVLVSCLAQAGPLPVLALPVIWLFTRGATLPASGLLAWALVVHVTGPVVRPLLIKRGVDLSLALILSGVIGGVVAFGMVGLFIGPVMLAVATTLLQRWMDESDGSTAATDPRPAG
ncbi:MAG: AI-2E family transporter [Candidatus Eisenbacteria bacterium]